MLVAQFIAHSICIERKMMSASGCCLFQRDHSISLIHSVGKNDGKFLWTREEALSTISNVKMIELPPSTSASRLELLHAQFSAQPNGMLSFSPFFSHIVMSYNILLVI